MSPERTLSAQDFCQFAGNHPQEFSSVCDSVVNYNITAKITNDIRQALSSGRTIVLVTNHQSYFEIETQRHFCQLINKNSPEKIQAFLLYSAPAVAHNVGSLLQIRNKVYSDCGLNLLGIIRKEDFTHPIYKNNITSEMKVQNRESQRIFYQAINREGNVIICPFEATLEGGRINPSTKKINGISSVKEDCLDVFINRNCLFLPCGIDGSYKVMDSKTHQPSEIFKQRIINPSQITKEKLVTFNLGEFIDPIFLKGLNLSNQNICHKIIIEVAKLISSEARGAYSQYV